MPLPASLPESLNRISPLPEAFFRRLEPLATRRELGAREHFSRLGVVQTTVGFLESGVMRAYLPTPRGDYNGHLYFAPTLVGDYTSLITGEPVFMPQQTLVASVVWEFPFGAVVALEDEFPGLARFRRVFAESLYLLKEQRELEIATLDAAQRYRRLRATVADLDQRLPQYEIAAFLGITASQLSRIRRSMVE